MNRIFTFLILALFFSFEAQAQYTLLELDIIRIGYASPTGSDNNIKSGINLGGELRLNATNDLSIGVGYELALFGANVDGDDVDVSGTGMLNLTADYYLNSISNNRAFIGAGLGRYQGGEVSIRDGEEESTIIGANSFGFAPRVGYEFGHIRLMAQYHIIAKSEIPNYLSFNIALTLWGSNRG